MMTSKYREDVKATLDGLLLGLPMVRAGKMFGYPAYYVKGKLFAVLRQEVWCQHGAAA